nr:zinc finger protein 583-like isoform X1 [Leptinotarsa decemlineata]
MITMENNQMMTFQSGEICTTMFQKLFEQKKASRFCDVNLFVNNKIIKAHRNVLACSSPYFDSILKHHRVVREQLTISCLDSEIFNMILKFMYTGEITIQYSNVEELLKLADHFILTKVIEYCIEFLGTKLNLDNCLFTYFLSQRFKLKHLGNIVENWISSHIDEICKGKEFLGLNSIELMEFFRNKNFILTTSKALNLLSQWILVDLERREKKFDMLIKCFPTNNLEPIEVFKHLDTCTLYNKSELCLYKFLDYLLRNNWMLSNFKTRYDVLQARYGQISSDKGTDMDAKHDKIMIQEKSEFDSIQNNFNSVTVKAKLKNRKQLILKKLMLFGLKPSLRMAALKMLACKKQNISLSDNEKEENEVEDPDEKVGIKCPICFTTINDSLLLEQHLALSHAKDVTYKCGLCSFVCQYHGDYLNHMKTHFSGPPFKCDYSDIYRCSYPHCKYTTSKKTQLASHAKTHNGVRPHTCGICGRGFMEKSHLVRHERIHLEEKPFKCSNCDYASSRRDKLKEHYTRHHGENASAKVPYKARPLRNNNNNTSSRPKSQSSQETSPGTTANASSVNFTQTNSTTVAPSSQSMGSEIQELIMHHQSHSTSAGAISSYHHSCVNGNGCCAIVSTNSGNWTTNRIYSYFAKLHDTFLVKNIIVIYIKTFCYLVCININASFCY